MTRREQETRRRRRERAEDRARAEREYAVGGPLIDAFAPVIGGGDMQHPDVVARALAERAERLRLETVWLAIYFAGRCWLVRAEQDRMLADWHALVASLPPVHVEPTHSTLPGSAPADIPLVP